MAKTSVAFFAFILILFVLAISESGLVKATLCERASQTWSGGCHNTGSCDNQCKSWEGALHGACHDRDHKKMCFCYFTSCAKLADYKLPRNLKPKRLANGEEAIKP
ncbi:hypothetical protein L6452_00853 [Arctium lappa]|uniref:Uncharacterized protein n=1 Tax=Arctium lappa TaxID=4217 RepID=A0ACB9FF41_ARCLA|nr:hypothetical protein L6452_00853 [Arctium lappa]